jgi:Uma2 family endonuclease
MKSQFTERDLKGAPLLAIEVLSPSTRYLDLAFKRARYETAGCPSYWVVDPLEPAMVCWELRDGRYEEIARADGTERITLQVPFPISVSPAELID